MRILEKKKNRCSIFEILSGQKFVFFAKKLIFKNFNVTDTSLIKAVIL